MTVTPRVLRCYYCGASGATVGWPSPSRAAIVWMCSDRIACTARARVLAARAVSEPPVFYCPCGCGDRVTFGGYTAPDGANGTPVAYVDMAHRTKYLHDSARGGAPSRS